MSGYLLDTNILIDVLKGQVWVSDVLVDLAPSGLAISLVTYGELYEGAYYDRDPHRALSDLASLLFDIEIADLSVPIMKRFGILRGQLSRHLRRQIGDMDFLIAATALEYDMTLVTRNIRDFQHIPALKVFEFDVAD